jgi:hypothetical protein
MKFTAYMPCIEDDQGQARWKRLANLPYVTGYGSDDFVQLPDDSDLRAYVNGFRVIGGLQVLRSGDLVRIVESGKKKVAFRFGLRVSANIEPGRGRFCAFTRAKIDTNAVRCPSCGQIFCEEVMEQIGSCVCGTRLAEDERPEALPEELL